MLHLGQLLLHQLHLMQQLRLAKVIKLKRFLRAQKKKQVGQQKNLKKGLKEKKREDQQQQQQQLVKKMRKEKQKMPEEKKRKRKKKRQNLKNEFKNAQYLLCLLITIIYYILCKYNIKIQCTKLILKIIQTNSIFQDQSLFYYHYQSKKLMLLKITLTYKKCAEHYKLTIKSFLNSSHIFFNEVDQQIL